MEQLSKLKDYMIEFKKKKNSKFMWKSSGIEKGAGERV